MSHTLPTHGLPSRPAFPPLLPSCVLLLVSGTLALRPLAVTWDTNPNYSFGLLVPFVALFLLYERRASRPLPEPGAPGARLKPLLCLCFLWGLIFIGFRLAVETDPGWRPGLWGLVSLYISALLVWLWLYGGRPWLRHFLFPICFLFFCIPWPFQIEWPLVRGLMQFNTWLVAGSMQLLGISAESAGNIIRLPNCTLFVEEACSGILSLQASLMLGSLLGEIYRLKPKRRLALVGASMAFALLGNYGRTLFLSLLAYVKGEQALAHWHDTAGFSILAFTAISAWLSSLLLREKANRNAMPARPDREQYSPSAGSRTALRLALGIFAATTLAETGTQAWFGWQESRRAEYPAWAIQFPETAREIALSETTRQMLLCDFHKTAQWQDARERNWTAFWFRYKPKASNKVALGTHTPESCLPLAGMKKEDEYPAFTAKVNGFEFNVQPAKFSTRGVTAYVFWVAYSLGGTPVPDVINDAKQTFSSKIRSHLEDIRNGYRGIGAETLEIAISGPETYEAARTAYLAALNSMVAADTGTDSPPPGGAKP
ncbi:MAG: exosortase/archaeosortase family protein [Methylacidiphilales bacterium]|nr:exosortase/archaeosortase family protein [Candidatus Methylacidiphilales bacterium]